MADRAKAFAKKNPKMLIGAAIALVVIGVLMSKEFFAFENSPIVPRLHSGMTKAEIDAKLAEPTCSDAVRSYCGKASVTPRFLGGQSLQPELLAVAATCGGNFPVDGACALQDPNFRLSKYDEQRGGTMAFLYQ